MKRFIPVTVLALAAAVGWQVSKACAPDFIKAVFSYARHPDLHRTGFIDGRLGVLQPTFARSYLVIAYRYLGGIGMTSQEREQARDYYADRLTREWSRVGSEWPARWRAVRAQIADPAPPKTSLITGGQLAYDPETHSFALNCAEDAFRVAIHTLEQRRGQFGARSRAFRSWVAAQDTVFANCESSDARIPTEAESGLPPLLRADRDYQIAAANFYAGYYEEALERFRRIGRDKASPWSSLSRYLVARVLLRLTEDPETAVQAGAQLRTESQSILADRTLAPIHGMTWNLVKRAGIRERDDAYFKDLARLLSSKGQGNGLREELWNYNDMYDNVIGNADPNALFGPDPKSKADPSRFREPDLTDWIFSFQARDPSAFSHCLSRWRETRSLPWLLAAISHANAANARTSGLLEAAAAVGPESPAYLTARFHLMRLYQALGDRPAAREALDALFAGGALKGLPSSTNLFRGLRMLAAPTFDDFLEFATRRPVMITLDTNLGETPEFYNDEFIKRPQVTDLFDADSTRVLNRSTPFRLLKSAALRASLAPELKNEALITAFTRGLMLGEDLSEIATALASAQPEIAPYAEAYLNENSEDGKRFAAAFLVLHRPEARPYFRSGITRQSRPGRLDPYRDNWWCPTDVQAVLDSRTRAVTSDAGLPDFLQGESSKESGQELERLDKLSAATDFLGKIVLDHAKVNPADARLPEALYWLVRAGHYGCADINTWKVARDSFKLLQQRYARTTWAKKTPTWFKNDYDIRRELKEREAENR